ncbi:hypothetical protein PIB30_070520 [Stylosanthes scabra]|uniref:Protein GAMETE EXPRESSED 1 n=1 Tax=Stylosanthes scabra TaxID=79078 RepID=A0ABU6QPN4_9FABA|nr:hypothetical protein [Stylosanthes scabra]
MSQRIHLLVIILLCFSLRCESWGWFSSSSDKETHSREGPYDNNGGISRGSSAEFSIEGFNYQKGLKLVENARKKMVGANTCWQNAYQHLFAGCSEILASDDKRSRLAWHLSDCFQRDSGRPSFPHCDAKSSMALCLRALDDVSHKVYLEFYLETNSICHQLQAYAFKHETERLVTELKSSAQYVEDKLGSIDEKSEHLLQGSKNIVNSMNSIDIHTQQVAQTAKNVQDHIGVVLRHSESVYEQTKKIEASQLQLKDGQEDMRRSLEDGVALLKESYNKQQQLLDGQSTALEGLNSLSEFQSKALEESRKTLQYFAEYGHRQHEELLQKQEEIQGLHDRLMENSKSILSAQESFESKQATMFIALDKLFALQNAMLVESRMIKAFFVYSISIFVIFMLTSTKQTYNVRPWLYIGLCATFVIEVAIIRFTNDNIEQQTWIINKTRLLFMVAASVHLLYAICTYRDYEMLNHQMLLTLMNKLNNIQAQKGLQWDLDTTDYVEGTEWVDADLPDDVNCLEDPDYIIPEEVADNSITSSSAITKCYNLRPRNHCR